MKFTWNRWAFGCDGDAFIIAKKICPEKENVPQFIVENDGVSESCKKDMVVEEGWCKFQVRTDWEDYEGEPIGGYHVVEAKFDAKTKDSLTGKRKRGWFPVWIVRTGDWY
jgi:hypothetical protein